MNANRKMSVEQQQGTNAVTVEEMGTQEQEPKKGNLVVWCFIFSLSCEFLTKIPSKS